MSNSNKKNQNVSDDHDNINLKGTLFGVGVIGLVIIVMWFGVWSLFLSR